MSGKLVLAITLTFLISMLVSATASAEISVGVKKGDWIEYTVATVTGIPPSPYPTWIKFDFQSVEGSIVTVKATMNMSDGTQNTQTMQANIATGSSGLVVIPAELKKGDTLYREFMGGYTLTIGGVETRTYADASRTVVYTNGSQYDVTPTVYWDQATGVLVEASSRYGQGDCTVNMKAVATNMWQAQLIDSTVFLVILIVILVVMGIVVAAAFFVVERKNKRSEEVNSPHRL